MDIAICGILITVLLSVFGMWCRFHGFIHGEFKDRWVDVHSAFSLYFLETFVKDYRELGKKVPEIVDRDEAISKDVDPGDFITKIRKNLDSIKASLNKMLEYSTIEEFLQMKNGFSKFTRYYTVILIYFIFILLIILGIILAWSTDLIQLNKDVLTIGTSLGIYTAILLVVAFCKDFKVIYDIYKSINGLYYELETDEKPMETSEYLKKIGKISQKIRI